MAGRPANHKKPGSSSAQTGASGLLGAARKLFHTNRAEATRLAGQALELARLQRDHSGAAAALNLMADTARMEGRMAAALELAEKALESARTGGDERGAADAVNNLGLLAWHRGEFESAVWSFERALRVREKVGTDHEVAATCNNLSLVHWEQGDLARAMDYQQRSLAIRERIGDQHGIGASHLNLGLIHVDLGDWDKALESYFRALAEKERVGDKADMALCYNNIGEVYLKRGKLGRAQVNLSKALELAQEAPSVWVEAEVLGNIGEACFRTGDFARSRDVCERDRQICLETEDREELAETLRRLAELALAEGRAADCRASLNEALSLCTQVGNRRELGNVHRVFGQLARAEGALDEARRSLNESVRALRAVGRNYELACTLLELGDLMVQANDNGQSVLSEALAIFEELGVAEKAERARGLLDTSVPVPRPEDAVSELAELACRCPALGDFCSKALEVAARELGASGAALLLRDNQVFRWGEAAGLTPGAGVKRIGVEAGGRRVGTLLLRGGMEFGRAKTLADLCALGILQAQSRPVPTTAETTRPGVRFPQLIGADTTLRSLFQTIERVAPTRANVLVLGESGTGKELVARTIHELSDRGKKRFVAVNCAAIPESLLEAELFGVEKGTATGVMERKGKLETAQGGTLFLDEIGDMSAGLQAKLLRVLQHRVFERVGGRELVEVDVRVIAATNRDLEQAMEAGQFRKDLFYRLNVITLSLPPLRERRADIPALVSFFLARYCQEYGKPLVGVAEDCLARLTSYDWPGNVRELENVVERAVILCQGDRMTAEDIPPGVQGGGAEQPAGWGGVRKEVKAAAGGSAEARVLAEALERNGWVVSRAAKALRMSRRQLYRLIKKYSLRRPEPSQA